MEDGKGEDLSLLARHAIGADPRDRRRATAHPSRQRAARGGPGGIPQVSPCRRGRVVSKSLDSRFKSELRTTPALMGWLGVRRGGALSHFHTLDPTRQRRGWGGSEPPPAGNALIGDPSLLVSDGSVAGGGGLGPSPTQTLPRAIER